MTKSWAFTVEKLYSTESLVNTDAIRVRPEDHTMGEENFLKYIGRSDRGTQKISTKKLTLQQRDQVIEFYHSNGQIRVISSHLDHLTTLLAKLRCELNGPIELHIRENKKFNNIRSASCLVKRLDGGTELWFIVFPSRQYVDQMAQLIQAIVDDLDRLTGKSGTPPVNVLHFRTLETTIAEWTGFLSGVRSFVRHGDVVAIGNIDFFLPGIRSLGFQETTPGWSHFGVADMFSAMVMIEKASAKRLVLVGMKECFWGDASAQYVEAIISAGGRHILYGSKAANLVDVDVVHEVIAPKSFFNIDTSISSKSTKGVQHRVDYQGVTQHEASPLLESFSIHQGGMAVTVPTVIGEDHHQRKSYQFQNPTCLDCENGHIAKVIEAVNSKLSRTSSELSGSVKFLPVHFITDYIYKKKEAIDVSAAHLAVHADDPDYENRRDDAFRKIGCLFGLYALQNGRQQHLLGRHLVIDPKKKSKDLDVIMKEVRPLLELGLGREAIEALISQHDGDRVPVNVLLAISMISQKYGYADAYRHARDIIKSDAFQNLDIFTQSRFLLLEMKHYTQLGAFQAACLTGHKIVNGPWLDCLSKIDQYCAFQRRRAVCLAAAGDREGFDTAISESDKEAPTQGDRVKYQLAVNLLWQAMGYLHFNDVVGYTISLDDVARTLGRVRFELSNMEARYWWQSNFEKGVLSSLFLEGALFLLHGDSNERLIGVEKLMVASLLNTKVGGHEQAEAFGEVVCGIEDAGVRELVLLAMRSDPESREKFRSVAFKWHPKIIGVMTRSMRILQDSPKFSELDTQGLWGGGDG